MSKEIIIFIFIMFLLSNNLYNIVWDIIKSLFYLVLALVGINFLNPSLATMIKKHIINIINLDQAFVKKTIINIKDSASEIINNKLKK